MQQLYGGALTPAPNPRSKRWIAWGLAVLGLAAVLVAGQQIYVRTSTGSGAQTAAEAPKSNARPIPGSLRATIDQLKGFIERERGMTFKKDVKITLLSEKAFVERVTSPGTKEEEAEAAEGTQDAESLFKALKLIGPGVDLDKLGEESAASSILGYYDFDKDELVVRGDKTTPFVKTILVHELTHALQDQYFNIDRPDLYETDDDSALGLDSAIEGDATRIEGKFYESLNAEEQRLADNQMEITGGTGPEDFPEALSLLFSFPYEVGPVFMDALFEAGGNDKMNGAISTPPTSAEQLLHPERYLAGEQPVKVAKPAAAGEEFDSGVMGEMGMIILLREAMPMGTALRASEGWGGDQYVAYRDAGKACVKFDLVMDTPKDRSEALSALRTWATHHGSATVTTIGNTIGVTACE